MSPETVASEILLAADVPERVHQSKIAILGALFRVYPSDLRDGDPELNKIRERTGTMPADEEPVDGAAVVRTPLREMTQSGYVLHPRSDRRRMLITPDGMDWLAQHSPGRRSGRLIDLGKS